MRTKRLAVSLATATATLLATIGPSELRAADNSAAAISEGFKFVEQDGAALYAAICQGCHMPNGQGATGAGMYPALAHNATLGAAAYPVRNILHGRRGMPAFAHFLTDAQVAAVTNYVRTHMGNDYKDTVSADDVKKLR